MPTKKSSRRRVRPARTGERRETYKGHEIVFPTDERRRRIFIDGRPVHYGTASGQYYLDVYAYDRAETLEEVVKRYINDRESRERRRDEED